MLLKKFENDNFLTFSKPKLSLGYRLWGNRDDCGAFHFHNLLLVELTKNIRNQKKTCPETNG